MYSDPRTSQFRRPWSPEPFGTNDIGQGGNDECNPYPDYPQDQMTRQRREESDISINALDLADFATTLQAHQNGDPYPSFPQHPLYPSPTLPPVTRGSLNLPSLTSQRTLSSNTHLSSTRSRSRPLSLPPGSRHTDIDPRIQSHDPEVDISQFPAWSHGWYNSPNTGPGLSPHSDIYPPLPKTYFDPASERSPFDPGYIHNESDHYTSDRHGYFPPSSLGHDSTRNLLPWSIDPLNSDGPIHPAVKEERIRMLEREFGSNGRNRANVREGGDFLDENGRPLVGTIDRNGNLVTQGPKKRIATRVLQILLACMATIPAIYAALVIKPKEPPPPANKPPAFVLYVLSVITLLVLLYLFVIHPCFCRGRQRRSAVNNNGMMVLPIQQLPGGDKGRRNKTGKARKGKGGHVSSGDVQVNLIVDPEAFGERGEEDTEDNDDGERSRGSQDARGKRRARRRGLFAGLAMEEDWKRARGWAKKLAAIDVIGCVLWGAAFVYLLIGKRCPSGGFEGWCNAYNASSAAACLLCVMFGVSTFFNVKDLHDSKVSPRTRP